MANDKSENDTATEVAYRAIRDRILSGEHAVGSHLSSATLSKSLALSRTPVREALRRLAAEGLVELIANRGAHVIGWTKKDAEEIFELRLLLECHACAEAARRIDSETIAELADLARQMAECARPGPNQDFKSLTQLNSQFHSAIIAASGNKRLSVLLTSVVEFSIQARTFEAYSQEDLARSMEHHHEMLQAFREGDGDWARSVMYGHLRAAYHVFQRAREKEPTS
ncbi:GntR family transcriptional regulator [Roseibium aggregatum]|uniref:GntR family transcriptional regulator n=1 Tax=Roseibium aggregatum TaxID=187304 RepID=A0A939EBB7_9HYPH|nr:GntR family transcriptional regulator [Roseibium aggregatum]MBN9669472.1 GntR family transcriptional regulator [Roseibium aggregatum]